MRGLSVRDRGVKLRKFVGESARTGVGGQARSPAVI
jgi:hypothetical protein